MKLGKRLIWAYLLAACLMTVCLVGCSFQQQTEEEVQGPTALTDSVTMAPIDLGNGLYLTKVYAASGAFPEDGKDTYSDNMLCADFENRSDKTLQYAKVHVALNGDEYTCEITTIPGGKTVHAFDTAMQQAPQAIETVTASSEFLVFFPEEPTADEKRISVTFSDGTIKVKNISNEDIHQELTVYYKTVVDGIYMGGITYRAKVGTLAAGQEVVGHSAHAGSNSELMFVTYGS